MPGWAVLIIIAVACLTVAVGAVRTYHASEKKQLEKTQGDWSKGMSFAVIRHHTNSRTYRAVLRQLENEISSSGHTVSMFSALPETAFDPYDFDGLIIVSEYGPEGIQQSVRTLVDRLHPVDCTTAIVITGRNYARAMSSLRKARQIVPSADFAAGIAVGKRDSEVTRAQRIRALISMIALAAMDRQKQLRGRRPASWISWKSRNPLAHRRHA